MKMGKCIWLLTALAAVLAWPAAAGGKNVDLVTLPKRNTVQLTIYNSEDITLVKETRHITLKKGANTVEFHGREPDARLDKLIVTNNRAFKPADE